MNALADYAKGTSSKFVLFDWALLRQVNVCETSFFLIIFFILFFLL